MARAVGSISLEYIAPWRPRDLLRERELLLYDVGDVPQQEKADVVVAAAAAAFVVVVVSAAAAAVADW